MTHSFPEKVSRDSRGTPMFTVHPHPFLQRPGQGEAKHPLAPWNWADVIRGGTRNHRSEPMISHDPTSAVQPMVSHRPRLHEGRDEKLGGPNGMTWDRGTKPQPDRTRSSRTPAGPARPALRQRDRIPPAQRGDASQRQQGPQQRPSRGGTAKMTTPDRLRSPAPIMYSDRCRLTGKPGQAIPPCTRPEAIRP